jgi:hypothetical protein
MEDPRNKAEHLIADKMTMRIIEFFEVVDVDHELR